MVWTRYPGFKDGCAVFEMSVVLVRFWDWEYRVGVVAGCSGIGLGVQIFTGCAGLWLGYVWLCGFTGGCMWLRIENLGSSCMHRI